MGSKSIGCAVESLETLQKAECWIGGFPCQDISAAGKGAGIRGSRSGLIWILLRAVRMVRPKILFLENVPAITTRGLGDILGSLSEAGYDTEWDCISAADVGAQHKRERIWIVSHAQERPKRPGLCPDGPGGERWG